MNILLPVDALLDTLYADSALADPSASAPVLTPSDRAALARFILVAAADIASSLAPALQAVDFPADDPAPGCLLTFDFDDRLPLVPEALTVYLSAAVTRAALRDLAVARGDRLRADLHRRTLDAALSSLRSLILAPSLGLPPPITPSYL